MKTLTVRQSSLIVAFDSTIRLVPCQHECPNDVALKGTVQGFGDCGASNLLARANGIPRYRISTFFVVKTIDSPPTGPCVVFTIFAVSEQTKDKLEAKKTKVRILISAKVIVFSFSQDDDTRCVVTVTSRTMKVPVECLFVFLNHWATKRNCHCQGHFLSKLPTISPLGDTIIWWWKLRVESYLRLFKTTFRCPRDTIIRSKCNI